MRALESELLASAARRADFPPETEAEVAFLGRSNVGKSSLLNRLVGRRRLAYTSATPGKTRLIHFYRLRHERGHVRFVDLPGYGWARVSRAERLRWQTLVESYLERRGTLRVAVLLQDLRRDITSDEEDLLAWLAERSIPTLVALTKSDKLKPMRRAARIQRLGATIPVQPSRVVPTSAETGAGIGELWEALERLLGS